jgi:hypothetical protein
VGVDHGSGGGLGLLEHQRLIIIIIIIIIIRSSSSKSSFVSPQDTLWVSMMGLAAVWAFWSINASLSFAVGPGLGR